MLSSVNGRLCRSVPGHTASMGTHDDGVEITSPLGTGKNNWSAFDRWGERDGYVYLVRIDNNVVLMDKSCLTPDELKELEGLLGNVEKANLDKMLGK